MSGLTLVTFVDFMLDRTQIEKIRKEARRAGVSMDAAVKSYDEMKKNPVDFLQPGQKGYKDSKYVKQQKKQEVRREKETKDAREEAEDRREYDKFHSKHNDTSKKHCFIP
ncbi:unnamed protein product [marine sediment metagenome]|uniref:Uncharacterized protein n=1 Tax=marine sediment metagenome TaxID=412755 RepID=X0XB10_9ZZZZ